MKFFWLTWNCIGSATAANEAFSVTRCWIKKPAQMFLKVAWVISIAVFKVINIFQNGPKVTNLFGYFCKQICLKELSKISQSGHTASVSYAVSLSCWRSAFRDPSGQLLRHAWWLDNRFYHKEHILI